MAIAIIEKHREPLTALFAQAKNAAGQEAIDEAFCSYNDGWVGEVYCELEAAFAGTDLVFEMGGETSGAIFTFGTSEHGEHEVILESDDLADFEDVQFATGQAINEALKSRREALDWEAFYADLAANTDD